MYDGLSALVAAMTLSVGVGHASDLTTKVNTLAGLLSTRSATKAKCATSDYPFDCQMIELSGHILFANAYMSIDEVYSTSDNPKAVIANSSNGERWSINNARQALELE
jgi:hypothetical protein